MFVIKKAVAGACKKVADQLPISDRNKDNVKAACKAASGGLLGALFQPSRIGPEPDRSAERSQNNNSSGSRNESVGVLRDTGGPSSGGFSGSSSGSGSNSVADRVVSDMYRP